MACSVEMGSLYGKTIRFTKEASRTAKWTGKVSFSFPMDKSSEEFGKKANT